MTTSIVVKNLSLDVPTFVQNDRDATTWLGTLLGAAVARPDRKFRTLLDNLTFTIEEGDRVALIGRNGAGKSTLLRVLTGAFVPTHGEIKITGTRHALLNIKLGFDKQATLVENIYLRGTAMGIPGKKVRELVRPVLEFAGLEEKAQDRLYTLSSGQRMRLGFSIATAISQDIILMDEWLGTGDAAFLERARQRMNDRINGSKIVVLASHNATLVKRLCNKGLVLSDGRIHFYGEIAQALKAYRTQVREAKQSERTGEEIALEAAEADGKKKVEKKKTKKKPTEMKLGAPKADAADKPVNATGAGENKKAGKVARQAKLEKAKKKVSAPAPSAPKTG
jgi:lipopolysaccharide transport system ATP-binding protein